MGGSGIGLFEILIFGGLIYFIFKKFLRRKEPARGGPGYTASARQSASEGDGSWQPMETEGMAFSDPPSEGIEMIRASDPGFDPETFNEFAQDVFFKVQAAWTRRDIAVMEQFLGRELLNEYKVHFEDLKAKGEINRLENIAVRRVEIVDAGEMSGEEFIIVRFTANLLDYTVDESTGQVVKGDPAEPVKFDERWAFARPKGTSDWKLEGIQ